MFIITGLVGIVGYDDAIQNRVVRLSIKKIFENLNDGIFVILFKEIVEEDPS